MLKKRYVCDVCREEKQPIDLYGLRFTNNHDFEFGPAASTDGVHICDSCTEQIKTKAPPLPGPL